MEQTTCCIVGGGPGGVVLAYLLARKGVPVVLLEEHGDFDRDFRGDTLMPTVMELLDQLGLAERLHELPHSKMRTYTPGTPGEAPVIRMAEVKKSKFPYVMLVLQGSFPRVHGGRGQTLSHVSNCNGRPSQ